MPLRFVRIGLVTICAALCAVAGGSPPRSAQSGGIARPTSHPVTLLIFPFESESRIASLSWLGEGLSELTTERLRDRGLNVFSRQERLAALEKIGLPDSARFSRATMVKISAEADADIVVFGRFVSDGKTVTIEARVLETSPPRLSPPLSQTGSAQDLLRIHARLTWQVVCAIDQKKCPSQGANADEAIFAEPPPSLRLDAIENFVRGLTASDDESRLRALREAARLEPAWDRPPYELGLIYFSRRDCESALPWFSRVPPRSPDGPETSFDTGVCHLLRNDAARAEAAFSGLIDRARSSVPRERIPEFPEAHNNLGVARLRLGRWSEAVSEFERAATMDTDEPDYWVNLGIARLVGKGLVGAVTAFERARNLAPGDDDARALLIAALESIGRGSDAAAIRAENSQTGGRAVQAAPQDSTGLVRLARVSGTFDRSILRTTAASSAGSSGKTLVRIEGYGARP